jgi:hypothetical protein
MSQYTTGTISVTTGAQLVTGSDTKWKNVVKQGDMLVVSDNSSIYEVAYVTSDTELYLSMPYAQLSESGATYALVRDFTPFRKYPELKVGDREPAIIITKALTMIDEDLHFLRSLYFPEFYVYDNVNILEIAEHNSRTAFDVVYLSESYAIALSSLLAYEGVSATEDNTVFSY